MTVTGFKVTQDHLFWYRPQCRMRLFLLVNGCDSLDSRNCYRNYVRLSVRPSVRLSVTLVIHV